MSATEISAHGSGSASTVGTSAAEQSVSFEARPKEEPREQAALARRIAVAVPLAVAIALLTLESPHDSTARWVTAALAVPVQFWCGLPFLRSAWAGGRRGAISADTLIALGTLASFVYSTVILIAQTHGYQHGVPVGQFEMSLDYYMGAAIVAAVLIARWCEAMARGRAGGTTSDLAPLGATLPRLAEPEASNADERLVAVEQMRRRVERPCASAPRIQRLADRISAVFAPFVVALAAVTALAWVLTGQGDHGMFASLHLERGMDATIAVLIVACPYALALAAPLAILAGMGRGANLGLLIRGGEILARSQSLDTIVLDEAITVTNEVLHHDAATAGLIALADTIKPEARDAVAGLRRMGLDVALLTGQSERMAHAFASAVGIESVLADVGPDEKAAQIERLQREGHRVAIVGDGVNDAAALAQADLGIAIGPGAGVAIEADISLLSGDLRGVPRALRLARETRAIALQNLGWAFAYNLIALPLAATGLLNPALAAVATGVSSIAVVGNSLRLRHFGREGQPTPVRGPFTRRASVAVAMVVPAVLLGGLVLGAPDTFGVPSSVTHVFTATSGATLEVEATPLTADEVGVHLYLYDATNAQTVAGRIPITATSSSGQRAAGTVYTIAPDHDFGAIRLSTGVWDLHISVTDSAGQRLGGSFAVPVNVAGAKIAATATLKPGTRPPAPASATSHTTASRPSSTGQLAAAKVAPDQLSVADELGPDIVAAWITHVNGHLSVQLHTLNGLEEPATIPVSLAHATIDGHCGLGCYDVILAGSASTLLVHAVIDGTAYTARLPVAFDAGGDRSAVALLRRVDAAQVKLRSALADESLASSPATVEGTDYKIQAPNRFAYHVALNGKLTDATIIIGTHEWDRTPGQAWQAGSFGTQPFSAASYLDWWADYLDAPRLLDLDRVGKTEIADIATVTELPGLGPVWLRLHIDATHDRMLYVRMITVEHFMTESWSNFNTPESITPPVLPAHRSAG
jgi:cation transport ATPase